MIKKRLCQLLLPLCITVATAAYAGEPTLYYDQANKVCQMLDKSVKLYQEKKIKEAYNISESAYWDVYDSIMEIKYRPYVSPAEIFRIEDDFHNLSLLITPPPTPQKIAKLRTAVKNMCDEVQKEAKYLTQHA
ncbi:hypothetical protein [Piscirickettsia litoralis]|uniref:Uncharacterized protein n=1 Tax=Piscirickettsia litoralis TaxID=1891921 RepID=A0ABX3A8H2_9GAMM|nr:hypothetical protein [Piscirickettsia litoralis]ODN43943.1 hypothetical protein BGC07_14935 [Piscirickettsia litoralis]